MSDTRSDEMLVLAIRRGDRASFHELYRRYSKRLFGYICRYLQDRERAEDLLQEVFITILEDRSLDPAKGTVAAWLFTVARNRCLNLLRDGRRSARGNEQLLAESRPLASSPEDVAARGQELSRAERALQALPAEQREALLLRHLADLSYREIAELTSVPEGTVKSRLHHALRALQRRLVGLRGEV